MTTEYNVIAQAGEFVDRARQFFDDVKERFYTTSGVEIRYGVGVVNEGDSEQYVVVHVTGATPVYFTHAEAQQLADALSNNIHVLGDAKALVDLASDMIVSLREIASDASDPDFFRKRASAPQTLQ